MSETRIMTRAAVAAVEKHHKSFAIGIALSVTNSFVTEKLCEGAIRRLTEVGITSVKILDVAGAFELVYGTRALFNSDVDGVIAIGALIRGETPHFDYLAASVSNGLAAISAEGLPVAFGLLTVDTVSQAKERAGGALGNKGEEAADALVRLIGGTILLGAGE